MENTTPLDSVSMMVEDQFENAPSWKRFLNLIIDYVIIVAIFVGIFLITEINPDSANVYLVIYPLYFCYYLFMEYLFGRTVGKFLTGTIVVREDNLEKLELGQALGRSISRFVPFEFFSFLGSTTGWHDRWSHTIVVNRKTLVRGTKM